MDVASLIDSLKEADPLVGALALFGSFVATTFGVKLLGNIYKYFLRPGKNLKKLGEWAVITGATDGIGKEYAIACAKQGMNVVLISRTEAKLQAVEKEISEKYGKVQTKYIVCDYSKFDQKARDTVSNAIKDLDVGVLVNNVGISYRYPLFFHELNDEEVTNLMEMNIASATWMTKYVIGGMAERKRGAIVNLSSGSAMITCPLLAEYAGAKSFLEKFSRALNAEYKSKGVSVQCQVPFYVATKLAKMRKSMMVPTPKEYVAIAIKWVGQADAVASPFVLHALQGWVMDHLPESIVSSVVMSMHAGIRKRGLKKDARLAAEASKKGK